MKIKTIVIAVLAAVLVATAYAGVKCVTCRGSGWNGQFRCVPCGGDGEFGN